MQALRARVRDILTFFLCLTLSLAHAVVPGQVTRPSASSSFQTEALEAPSGEFPRTLDAPNAAPSIRNARAARRLVMRSAGTALAGIAVIYGVYVFTGHHLNARTWWSFLATFIAGVFGQAEGWTLNSDRPTDPVVMDLAQAIGQYPHWRTFPLETRQRDILEAVASGTRDLRLYAKIHGLQYPQALANARMASRRIHDLQTLAATLPAIRALAVQSGWLADTQSIRHRISALESNLKRSHIVLSSDLTAPFMEVQQTIDRHLATAPSASARDLWQWRDIQFHLTMYFLEAIADAPNDKIQLIRNIEVGDRRFIDVVFTTPIGPVSTQVALRNAPSLMTLRMRTLMGQPMPFDVWRFGADKIYPDPHLDIGTDQFDESWAHHVLLHSPNLEENLQALQTALLRFPVHSPTPPAPLSIPTPEPPAQPPPAPRSKPSADDVKPSPHIESDLQTETPRTLNDADAHIFQHQLAKMLKMTPAALSWLTTDLMQRLVSSRSTQVLRSVIRTVWKGRPLSKTDVEHVALWAADFKVGRGAAPPSLPPMPTSAIEAEPPHVHILADPPQTLRQVFGWTQRFLDIRNRMTHQPIVFFWMGEIEREDMRKWRALPWREALENAHAGGPVQAEFYDLVLKTTDDYQTASKHLTSATVRIRGQGGKQTEKTIAQFEMLAAARVRRMEVRFERQRFDAFRLKQFAALDEEEASALLRRQDMDGAIRRFKSAETYYKRSDALRFDAFADQLAALVQGKRDVIAIVDKEWVGLAQRLAHKNIRVEESGVVPLAEQETSRYLLFSEPPEESPSDHELRLLRSWLAKQLEGLRVTQASQRSRQRLEALVGLWSRRDFNLLSEALRCVSTDHADIALLRVILAQNLAQLLVAHHRENAYAVAKTLAERLDEDALARFGYELCIFDMPASARSIPSVLYEWLLDDGRESATPWITPDEELLFGAAPRHSIHAVQPRAFQNQA